MVVRNSNIIHNMSLLFAMTCCPVVLAGTTTNDVECLPDGVPVEFWDCWRSAMSVNFDYGEHPTKVAVTVDSIYFKYHAQDIDDFDDGCWVRGLKGGDGVAIKSGLHLEDGSYLNSCNFWTRSEYIEGYSIYWYYAQTLEDDVVFKYDADRKWLYTLQKIWITPGHPYKWQMEGSNKEGPFAPDDLFGSYELIYVPEEPLTPQPPKFLYEAAADGKKYMRLNGSVFSVEGPAMHFDRLKFRIYIDGNPIQGYYDYAEWCYGHDFSGWNIIQVNLEYEESFQDAYAVMVYKYEDGSEIVSAPAPIVDVSGVDEVFREDIEDIDAPVYDLSGRRVRPDRLAPGV